MTKEFIMGRNPVLEALKSNREINKLWIAEGGQKGSIQQVIAMAKEANVLVQFVPRKKIDQMVEGNHQGVVASVAAYDYAELDDLYRSAEERKEDPFFLILDEIEDPHNLGSIMRTADAVGAHGIIIPKRRAVGLTATVAKSSTGAIEHTHGTGALDRLGGIANRMRTVLALYMVGAVSISSFPLFSGFVSKELVVEAADGSGLLWLVVLLKIASVGTFLHTGLKLPYGTWVGREGFGPRANDGARIQVGPVPVSMYVAMGISAVLNLAIGVYPRLLYDLLPHAAPYDLYTLGKVTEKSQILLFTALGFWLLLSRLHAYAMLTVDTDWLYRRLPRLVRTVADRTRTARQPVEGEPPAVSRPDRVLQGARMVVLERISPAASPTTPPVAATWLLGAVVMVTAVVLLIASLA
jgi:hypothetical protein